MCLGITPELDTSTCCTTWSWSAPARGACGRGLCRVRRPVGAGARPALVRRPGRRLGPDRELSRLSDRHFRRGAGRTRVQPGAEVRRRGRDSACRWRISTAAGRRGGRMSRCGSNCRTAAASTRRTVVVASGARYRQPNIPNVHELRGRWRVVLGVGGRGETVRRRGDRAGRRRQFGRAGGGVSGAQGQAPASRSSAARARSHDVALPDRSHRGAAERVTFYTGAEVDCAGGRSDRGAVQGDVPRPRLRKVLDATRCGTCSCSSAPIRTATGSPSAWRSTPRASSSPGAISRRPTCRSARAPLPLETSVAGVFAIGDVRAGSTKRVGAAIGEGAAVVAQIHAALAN